MVTKKASGNPYPLQNVLFCYDSFMALTSICYNFDRSTPHRFIGISYILEKVTLLSNSTKTKKNTQS